jgi:hypothetical protein
MSDRDYQLRQIRQIALRIEWFEKKEITLAILISNLKGLLVVLTGIDEKWEESVTSEWWTLEQVDAVAIDHGVKVLGPKEQVIF